MPSPVVIYVLVFWLALFSPCAHAEILWSHPEPELAHNTDAGADILHGAVRRGNVSDSILYFKFHVDPLSDDATEPYFAAFQLFEGDTGRLAVGNSLKAWAYSAFNTDETGANNTVAGDIDLHSAHPESYGEGKDLNYELPRRGIERTIIFKVQFVPNGDDLITVWLEPNLAEGATEDNQLSSLTIRFKADASFDQIRLLHGGLGGGWIFSNMAIATAFNDFIVPRFWQRWWFVILASLVFLAGVVTVVRVIEKRKFYLQLQRAKQERALERERTRIAQDLHDDLGSSLTRISLLGGLLHEDKKNPEQIGLHAEKIVQAADQTVRALEEIVWAVRPDSDTLQSLIDYIAHFANELFAGNLTRCRLDFPDQVPARALPPDIRHNIFLIVKETLTNVLKHAQAGEVQLQVRTMSALLEIVVTDNGKGFDPNVTTTSGLHNGLENMRRRAEAAGGTLSLTSEAGKGSRMEFRVVLRADITG